VLFLDGFAGGQRKRPHGAPVKSAEKRDVQFAFCVPASQLKGGFHRFGTGVSEIYLFSTSSGSQSRQFFSQDDLGCVIKIRTRHVQQPFGLVGNGLDDMRMTVTGGVYGNAGRKVKKDVAVDIMNP